MHNFGSWYLEYWLPWWLSGKESSCQCRRYGFDPWVRKITEKEMVTHSSILAWEILWTTEPGGLQFMWWQLDLTLRLNDNIWNQGG